MEKYIAYGNPFNLPKARFHSSICDFQTEFAFFSISHCCGSKITFYFFAKDLFIKYFYVYGLEVDDFWFKFTASKNNTWSLFVIYNNVGSLKGLFIHHVVLKFTYSYALCTGFVNFTVIIVSVCVWSAERMDIADISLGNVCTAQKIVMILKIATEINIVLC